MCSHRGAVAPDGNSPSAHRNVLPVRGPAPPAARIGSGRARRLRCMGAGAWRRLDGGASVVPLRGGIRTAADISAGRLDRVSDQAGLDDYGVWEPARGDDWTAVLLWSPYVAESERPQIFLPGAWIAYLRALSACRSREWQIGRAHV